MHIVQTILQEGTAANDTATALSVGTADGSDTSVNNTTSGSAIPVTIVQEVEQNVMENTNNNMDMYTSLLANMQSQQKTIQDSMNTNASPQPAWNDPLVHISTASGKSVTQYLNICDIVQSTVIHEEDVILGGQGVQRIVMKSGQKKPCLENLTLSQWSANPSILYKLVGDNKLSGTFLMDYLSYTTKVYELVQRFNLVSVLLYDREYRKLQSSMGFRWGTDVLHLHTLFLQPRDKPAAQGSLPKKDMPITQSSGRQN